jgi:hypothetical protein
VVIIGVAMVAAAGGVWAIWWFPLRADNTLPQTSCGRAETHFLSGGTQILQADPHALTCFGAAARGCKPASIEVTEMGVDAGTDYVFTIEPGGTPCQVSELSQGYGGGRPPARRDHRHIVPADRRDPQGRRA